MKDGILKLVDDTRALNPKVFSLTRMLILSSLYDLDRDGASYREMKAVLGRSDGALYTNLKALEAMGYVESKAISVEGKALESFNITDEGKIAWNEARDWLKTMLDC